MARHTNKQVITRFLNGLEASAKSLNTNGTSLFSYGLEIARWYGGKAIVFDYTSTGNAFKSMTTSQHVGLIKREVPVNNVMLVEFAESIGIIK